jgi:hypothetical protein
LRRGGLALSGFSSSGRGSEFEDTDLTARDLHNLNCQRHDITLIISEIYLVLRMYFISVSAALIAAWPCVHQLEFRLT